MTTISRSIKMSATAGLFLTLCVTKANACGNLNLQALFQFPAQTGASLVAQAVKPLNRGLSDASIVGLWKTQLLSKGNESHNPAIPDGALIDFGYTQWHSDGTEILESGGHAPITWEFGRRRDF